jgi:hypothetical protein
MKRILLTLAAILLTFTAGSAFGIYESNCPQICTPTCPCSLQCQGPFGPTTCGQAGQACTGFASGSETEADVELFTSFEDLLNSLEGLPEVNAGTVLEATEVQQEEAVEGEDLPVVEPQE